MVRRLRRSLPYAVVHRHLPEVQCVAKHALESDLDALLRRVE